MELGLVAAGVAVALIVAVGLYIRSFRRRLVGLRNETDRTWMNLDTHLRERNNQLPKLVETCRSFLGSGEKTLQAVLNARADLEKADTVEGKAGADRILKEAIDALLRAGETEPGLRSNTSLSKPAGATGRYRGEYRAIPGQLIIILWLCSIINSPERWGEATRDGSIADRGSNLALPIKGRIRVTSHWVCREPSRLEYFCSD